MKKINVNQIKKYNRKLVYEEIIRNNNMTRVEIARRTRLSNATVSTIIEELACQNILVEKKDITSSIGRKPSILEFTRLKKIICIDFAIKNFLCKIKNLKLETLSQYSYTYNDCNSFKENVQMFCSHLKEELNEEIQNDEILGVGVSVSGPYIQKEDKVITKLIPEIKDIKLKQFLTEQFALPIFIDHDVKLATMAEIQFIDYYNAKNIFYLYIGEGIGGTLSIQGNIYGGANEFAGEVGQISLASNLSAEEAISFKRLKETAINHYNWSKEIDFNKAIIEQYNNEDFYIMQEIDTIVLNLSNLISNIIYMLNPHIIVIGGQYRIFGNKFLEKIKVQLEEKLFPEIIQDLELQFSYCEDKSSLVGAGKMVIQEWLNTNYYADYNL